MPGDPGPRYQLVGPDPVVLRRNKSPLNSGRVVLKPLASGTKQIKIAVVLVLTVMLLDSSLLVSASLPQRHLTPSSPQSNTATPLALLATPAGAWSFADGRYLSANMPTRGEVMSFILTNPGVYLREISEDLGLSMGVAQYHVWVLAKNGEVEECRCGRYRRFFGAGRYQEEERVVISLLRQGTTGRILAALAEDEPLTHLSLSRVLGLSSQALSWQIRRLKDIGVVETGIQGGYHLVEGIVPIVRAHSYQGSPDARLAPAPAVTR